MCCQWYACPVNWQKKGAICIYMYNLQERSNNKNPWTMNWYNQWKMTNECHPICTASSIDKFYHRKYMLKKKISQPGGKNDTIQSRCRSNPDLNWTQWYSTSKIELTITWAHQEVVTYNNGFAPFITELTSHHPLFMAELTIKDWSKGSQNWWISGASPNALLNPPPQ